MADSKPSLTNPDLPTAIAAGIALISGIAAIFGGFTGGVARLARNDATLVPAAVILSLLAVGLAMLAAEIQKRKAANASADSPPLPGPNYYACLAASFFCFTMAGFVVATGLSQSLARNDRPRINAKWTVTGTQTNLTGTVSASGLKADDKVFVTVVRLLNNGDPTPSAPPSPKEDWRPTPRAHQVTWSGIVYQQVTGPDIDGNSVVNFEAPLPPGYDGMLVVVSLTDYQDSCPGLASDPPSEQSVSPTPRAEVVKQLSYACLTLDAPKPVASPSTPKSPTNLPSKAGDSSAPRNPSSPQTPTNGSS